MNVADAARQRYVDNHDAFVSAAQELDSRLRAMCQSAGVSAQVEVRAKSVASFVKKVIRNPEMADPWAEIDDKVGGRIIVADRQALGRVRPLLEHGYDELVFFDQDDKSSGTDVRLLAYRGYHAQVVVPTVLTTDAQPIEAEVQLRTLAEHLWNETEHRWLYKGVIQPSARAERRLMRLSVLTEIFDEEVDYVAEEIEADPAFASARLLHVIEAEYLRFVAEPGNADLSLEVLDQLSDMFADQTPSEYAAALHTFAEDHATKLSGVYDEYGALSAFAGEFAYWLLSQPESLVIVQLLETRPMALASAVVHTELEPPVRRLSGIWGVHLPNVD